MTSAGFDVLEGGLLTTIQDAGRRAWAHLGVPESGAADPWSRAVANLLIGNDPAAAVLEMTLAGPTLAVRSGGGVTIGLAGADLGARIRDGRRLAPGRSHWLADGDVLEVPGDSSHGPATGCRAYLAIPGGIDAPIVLGSRSTCLAAGFGGLDGRALRTGDTIAAVPAARPGRAGPVAPASLRVVAGPAPGLEIVRAIDWQVGSAADRVGVRLDGEPVPAGIGGEVPTQGIPWGAIQVPADGRPILLGADHQTTGGYRVVGVVITADLPVLGQLRPGSPVRLEAVDRPAALAALRGRRDALVAGVAALRDAGGWGALIDSAGG